MSINYIIETTIVSINLNSNHTVHMNFFKKSYIFLWKLTKLNFWVLKHCRKKSLSLAQQQSLIVFFYLLHSHNNNTQERISPSPDRFSERTAEDCCCRFLLLKPATVTPPASPSLTTTLWGILQVSSCMRWQTGFDEIRKHFWIRND